MKTLADANREPAFVTPEGAERRVLSYGGRLMLVQFTFPAGVTSAPHSHPHEQIGYVVSGEIDLCVEGLERARLLPGGSYYVPPDVKHYIITLTPAVLLDCFTPLRQDFLDAAAAAPLQAGEP
ncbi:MAG: cupin domain-containing protein [Anaerolineae bacterium]|nr:cupin domain-containing protein [Anaerolineae bacterium]